jgi:hypothetical protein
MAYCRSARPASAPYFNVIRLTLNAYRATAGNAYQPNRSIPRGPLEPQFQSAAAHKLFLNPIRTAGSSMTSSPIVVCEEQAKEPCKAKAASYFTLRPKFATRLAEIWIPVALAGMRRR